MVLSPDGGSVVGFTIVIWEVFSKDVVGLSVLIVVWVVFNFVVLVVDSVDLGGLKVGKVGMFPSPVCELWIF